MFERAPSPGSCPLKFWGPAPGLGPFSTTTEGWLGNFDSIFVDFPFIFCDLCFTYCLNSLNCCFFSNNQRSEANSNDWIFGLRENYTCEGTILELMTTLNWNNWIFHAINYRLHLWGYSHMRVQYSSLWAHDSIANDRVLEEYPFRNSNLFLEKNWSPCGSILTRVRALSGPLCYETDIVNFTIIRKIWFLSSTVLHDMWFFLFVYDPKTDTPNTAHY